MESGLEQKLKECEENLEKAKLRIKVLEDNLKKVNDIVKSSFMMEQPLIDFRDNEYKSNVCFNQ